MSVRAAVVESIQLVKGVTVTSDLEALPLAAFGVDSLDLIEVGMVLEDRLGFELDNSQFDNVETFGDVINVVERQALDR